MYRETKRERERDRRLFGYPKARIVHAHRVRRELFVFSGTLWCTPRLSGIQSSPPGALIFRGGGEAPSERERKRRNDPERTRERNRDARSPGIAASCDAGNGQVSNIVPRQRTRTARLKEIKPFSSSFVSAQPLYCVMIEIASDPAKEREREALRVLCSVVQHRSKLWLLSEITRDRLILRKRK